MFLRRHGYSKRFTFDIIYSTLQKSLRRGDITLSIEMGYEFQEFPHILKKRLIQNCTEDCPDLNLINDIFNCPPDLQNLLSFIPVICKHVKCHDGCYGMRIACEMEPIKDPPILSKDHHDDLLTLLRKCFFHISSNEELKFILYFQRLYQSVDLFKIYQFIGENKTFLYMLCVWETTEFIHEKYEVEPIIFERNKIFDKLLKLPYYVYDKHVKNCPKAHKSYKFFIDNLVLYPRKAESELEKEAKKLFINTEKGIGEIFNSIIDKSVKNDKKNKSENDLEVIDFKVKLIQTKKINETNQIKVYFCSLNNGRKFDRILKGPFENEDEINSHFLSDTIKQKLLSMSPSYFSKKVSYKNQVYILSVNMIRIDKSNIIKK